MRKRSIFTILLVLMLAIAVMMSFIACETNDQSSGGGNSTQPDNGDSDTGNGNDNEGDSGGTNPPPPTVTTTYITLNVDGSTYDTITCDGSTFTLPTPTKSGYTFVAWYKESSFVNKFVVSEYIADEDRADITIYAKFTQDEVAEKSTVVKFMVDSVQYDSVVCTDSITMPADPTKDGFEFVNWYLEDTFVNVFDKEKYLQDENRTDITLYAKFNKKEVPLDGLNKDINYHASNEMVFNNYLHEIAVYSESVIIGKYQEVKDFAATKFPDYTIDTGNLNMNGTVLSDVQYVWVACDDELGKRIVVNEGLGFTDDVASVSQYLAANTNTRYLVEGKYILHPKYSYASYNLLNIPTDNKNGVHLKRDDASCIVFADKYIDTAVIPSGTKMIADWAFAQCTALRKVTFESGALLDYVGERSFTHSGVVDMTIPTKYIGALALAGCPNLRTVELIGTEEIGEYCFADSRKLVKTYIPSTVTTFGKTAYNLCYGDPVVYYEGAAIPSTWDKEWNYDIWTGLGRVNHNYVLNYKSSNVADDGKEYIFDDKYNRYYLNADGSVALYKHDKDGVAKVVIAPNVQIGSNSYKITIIGGRAFYLNSDVEEIVLPEGIVKLEEGSFHSTNSLIKINIPASVVTIEKGAFAGNCTYIYPEATSQPKGWANNWSANNPVVWKNSTTKDYVVVDGINYRIYSNKNIAYVAGQPRTKMVGRVTIPSNINVDGVNYTVEGIMSSAFDQCELMTDIILPDTIKSIGSKAFRWCTGLTHIDLPANLEVIGNEAFEITNIDNLVIPANVTNVGSSLLFSTRLSTVPNIFLERTTFNLSEIGTSWFEEFANLNITPPIKQANVYLFSDTNKVGVDGVIKGYWHYVNGVPTIWE